MILAETHPSIRICGLHDKNISHKNTYGYTYSPPSNSGKPKPSHVHTRYGGSDNSDHEYRHESSWEQRAGINGENCQMWRMLCPRDASRHIYSIIPSLSHAHTSVCRFTSLGQPVSSVNDTSSNKTKLVGCAVNLPLSNFRNINSLLCAGSAV